jgi:hypothetical protein
MPVRRSLTPFIGTLLLVAPIVGCESFSYDIHLVNQTGAPVSVILEGKKGIDRSTVPPGHAADFEGLNINGRMSIERVGGTWHYPPIAFPREWSVQDPPKPGYILILESNGWLYLQAPPLGTGNYGKQPSGFPVRPLVR